MLISKLNPNDIVVLSGSVNAPTLNSIYAELIIGISEKKAYSMVDTSGIYLKKAIEASPFLVKVNKKEFELLMNKENSSLNEIITYAQSLIQKGIEIIIVTLGEKGSVLISRNKKLLATHKVSNVINTTGAGDCFLAGFIYRYFRNFNEIEALKFATTLASNYVSVEKIEKLDLNKIQNDFFSVSIDNV